MAIIAAMIAHQSPRFAASVDSRVVEDVDAMAVAMSDGLNGEYVQLEARPFRGRWTTVRLDSVVVQFGSEDVAVARRVRIPADRWAFMVPLDVPGAAKWNGRVVREEDIIVCPPRTECLAFDPAATRFAIISAGLTTTTLSASRRFVVWPAAAPTAVACGTEALALRRRLIALRETAESRRRLTIDDADADLDAHLNACLERSAAAQADVGMCGSRSRIVCRAEEFFRSHLSEGVSVAQLSTMAGVSERSLRNAFYDVYTTSPKRYMRLWQLHQVRRALRSAEPGAATVTDVATCHGFYELGRFAGAYKSLFGEAPSETLNKARHRQPTGGAA